MNDFQRRMDRSQRTFDIVFRLVTVVIVLAFLAIIGFWIIMGTVAYKTVEQVDEKGIKGVVEQVWCGKQKDCTIPTKP